VSKVLTNFFIRDGVYTVSLRVVDFSQNDILRLDSFGQPEIPLGGTFPGPFTLPARFARLVSDQPFVAKFDFRDEDSETPHEDARAKGDAWAAEVVERIESAMTTLRSYDVTFVREELTNI
jgi:hypothetical protein